MTDTSKAQSKKTAYNGIWGPAFKEAGVAFVAAALFLSIFYSLAFRWIHPEFVPFMDREASRLIAAGKDLIPVSVGRSRVEGGSTIIEDFTGDEAILALARPFQAEDYPFIKVNLQGFTRYSKCKILWRRAEDPSQTHALEFNRSGDQLTQIAMVYGNENYRGQIADFALLFYDGPALGFENNDHVAIAVHNIELRPFSHINVFEQIFEDWINPPLWRGSSNNTVTAVHRHGMLSPNASGYATLFLAIGLISLRRQFGWRKPRIPALPAILILCLFLWIILDLLRWQWRVEQARDSNERYGNLPLEERIRNSPSRCNMFADCMGPMGPTY